MSEEATPQVGAGIRRRRRGLELTLAEVAQRTGLSVPFLSQIETNHARPSMRSLQKIADALDTTAARLFAVSDQAQRVDVVRAGEGGALAEGGGGTARPLVRGQQAIQALEFVGTHDWEREFVHRNDELLYVAEGAVEAEADGVTYRLTGGDTLYLTGGVRHRWRSVQSDSRVLVVAVADHIEQAALER
ncbi:helix-turn-helix transcriptional regulator [Streptacidiphilus sp. 4-A2]|nr:helix-turn-helix transcriptional regulator [Streptacidiphilus sp. 4-A2]